MIKKYKRKKQIKAAVYGVRGRRVKRAEKKEQLRRRTSGERGGYKSGFISANLTVSTAYIVFELLMLRQRKVLLEIATYMA